MKSILLGTKIGQNFIPSSSILLDFGIHGRFLGYNRDNALTKKNMFFFYCLSTASNLAANPLEVVTCLWKFEVIEVLIASCRTEEKYTGQNGYRRRREEELTGMKKNEREMWTTENLIPVWDTTIWLWSCVGTSYN